MAALGATSRRPFVHRTGGVPSPSAEAVARIQRALVAATDQDPPHVWLTPEPASGGYSGHSGSVDLSVLAAEQSVEGMMSRRDKHERELDRASNQPAEEHQDTVDPKSRRQAEALAELDRLVASGELDGECWALANAIRSANSQPISVDVDA